MQLVGSLIHTLSDILFDGSLISNFMQDPRESHLKQVNKNVHYVNKTYELCTKYCPNKPLQFIGYTNLDWDGDLDD